MSTSRKFKRDCTKIDAGTNKIKGHWTYKNLLEYIRNGYYITTGCAQEIIRDWIGFEQKSNKNAKISLYDMSFNEAYRRLMCYINGDKKCHQKMEISRTNRYKHEAEQAEREDDSI